MQRKLARSVGRRPMVEVEVANHSGVAVDEEAATDLGRRVLAAEGGGGGGVGLVFVDEEEGKRLKREHLGRNEPPTVLAFPIDAREQLPAGGPRPLRDVVRGPEG